MYRTIIALSLLTLPALSACDTTTGPDDEPPGNSRDNPAAVGETVEVDADSFFFGEGTIRLTLLETVAGDEAWAMVQEGNPFNAPAPAGSEWLLARFRVEVVEVVGSAAFEMHDIDWEAVGGDGTVHDKHDHATGVEPYLEGDGFAGASWTGWTSFTVREGDTGTVAVYQRGESGEVWFSVR